MATPLRVSLALSPVLLFALAGGALAQPVVAHWVLVEVVGDTTYFLDSASVVIGRSGLVEAWRKTEYARPKRMQDVGRSNIQISSLRIDCARSTWVGRETIHYLDLKVVRRSLSKSTTILRRPNRPHDRDLLALACDIAAQKRAAR